MPKRNKLKNYYKKYYHLTMIKKYLLHVCLLLAVPYFAMAQTLPTNIDSLTLALKNAPDDSIKMVVLFNLAINYVENNKDSSLYYAKLGTDLAKKINQPLWIAHFITECQSYIAMISGNYPLSFKLANEALQLTQDQANEKNVYIPSDYEFRDPHKFRLSQAGYTLHQIGNIYYRTGNDKKAIEYYKQEIQIFNTLKSKKAMALVQSNMNLGTIYAETGKLDSAIIYSKIALTNSEITGWKVYNGYMLNAIGLVYVKRNRVDSARYFYQQSLSVSRQQENPRTEMLARKALAQLYDQLHQPDSAKYYALSLFLQALNYKEMENVGDAAYILSNAWKMQGNTDSAFAYLSIAKSIGDSLSKSRTDKLLQFQTLNFENQIQLEKQVQDSNDAKNKIRTIALVCGVGLLSILALLFYRNNRQKQKANVLLRDEKQKVESTLSELKSTQSQLIQSEKMASLGELTAGIAHEIQNPLNFVNNFSDVNSELVDEATQEIENGNISEATSILKDIKENEQKINHHGKRADAIVKGMLQHSRTSSGQKEMTDINALCDEYLRLSYHGLRAKEKSFNAKFETDFDDSLPKLNVVPQDIGRVILNLINNAFYAVNERKKLNETGYDPTIWVSTKRVNDKIEISVKDNGIGIPEKIKEKIFQPFFTTKPTGSGTGLGLSLSYDIVKAHGGEIKVESKEGEGSTFTIQLSM